MGVLSRKRGHPSGGLCLRMRERKIYLGLRLYVEDVG
jgi:hypothetical protein